MVTISNEQKIYELSQIWKDAEYNFAFWDKVNIDWDAEYKKALSGVLATTDVYEYYRELARFINLLGDGHTGISFPPDIMQNTEYYSMLPVYLARVEGRFIVVSVGENYKNVIPMFSELKKFDGVDIGEYIKEEILLEE